MSLDKPSGYIKMHRAVRKSAFYKDSEYVHLWVHLLLSANHSVNRVKLKNSDKFVDLFPGQLLTSRDALAEQTAISASKVQRVLAAFESEQQIEQQTFTKYRVISIVNWGKYQQSEQQNEQQMNSKRTADEQQMNTNKNVKKEEEKTKTFSASFDAEQPAEQEFYLTAKKRKLTGERLSTFNEFMDAFGDRRGKAQAADSWYDLKPFTRSLFAEIMAGAKRYNEGRDKMKQENRTPKMAQGWLTGRRWEDEAPGDSAKNVFSPVTQQEAERLRKAMAKYDD